MTSANVTRVRQSARARKRRDDAHARIAATAPGSWIRQMRVLDYARAVMRAGGNPDDLVRFLDEANEAL